MSTRASLLVPIAAMLGSIVSLCVGSSYAKTLFPVLGPEGATALRLLVASALLLTLRRPWRRGLTRRDALTIAAYGAVLGTMNLLFYLAIARIPMGLAIAIEFTGPLVLAMAASRRARDFVWVAFATLGLGLLLPIVPGSGGLDPVGVAFAFGAAVCWALYIVTGQRAGRVDAGQATAYGMAVAALVVLPIGAPGASAAWHQPGLWLAGLAVGVLSSALPYSLEMIALKRLPKQTFGILLSMEPAVGALVAIPMLGERLSAVQWLAIGCIVVASTGTALGARPAMTA
jgi:inner membrane transporter RhtA